VPATKFVLPPDVKAGSYKYAMTGRDTRGRLLYLAGKVVTFEQNKYWKVISIHRAD
jgi:hypothetical protein